MATITAACIEPSIPTSTSVVSYLRVSTGRQAESDLSIPDQRAVQQTSIIAEGKGMDSGIVSAFIGLGGGLIGGGLTSGTTLLIDRANRSRFSRERVWDERWTAYTKIIAAVAEIKRQDDEIAFKFSDEAGGENYYGSPALIAASTTWFNMERKLDRLVSNNRIIVSTEMWRWHVRPQVELEDIGLLPVWWTPR